MEIALVLGLLGIAIGLFALEFWSVDITTLLLLLALVITGILEPAEAFAGFSSEIMIILASIFVIGGAFQLTGVLDAVGSVLLRLAGKNSQLFLAILMTVAGGLSAFMNNTTVTAMFVPTVFVAARKLKINPSKFLIPLAYASIMGGMCTLIGTSTNLAVSGYLESRGWTKVGLFEITPIGLIALGVGIPYMVWFGRRLLPERVGADFTEEYALRDYLSEISVLENSKLVGQMVYDCDLAQQGFRIIKIIRGGKSLMPGAWTEISANDTLLVEGKVEELLKIKEKKGVEIKHDLKLVDLEVKGENLKIAEALLTPQSSLAGNTLKSARFRQRFGLTVLAMFRHGQPLREELGDIRLRFGDLLLVQGEAELLEALWRHRDLWILEELSSSRFSNRKGWYTIGFFAAALIANGLGWLPLSIAFLGAALLVLLFRCLTVEEAYDFIDWRLLILIAGMTAFGTAMRKTGAAEFLADLVVGVMEPVGLMGVLGGFILLTVLLSIPMSNAAAALVMLPIALQTAQKLGSDPHTFGIAIMLAASLSFIGPFEPACVLVYGPGKYRFRDFVIAGTGLTLILVVVVLVLLPVLWPL
jgi:di/tricarboxylate transporter